MLYPPLAPRRTGWIEVGDGHRVHWDDSGAAGGMPVVVLHGGPGGASGPVSRRWFDPRRHRIITTDQRGCGRSTPAAGTQANTTPHLVADLERLRAHLGIDRWIVCGGSWGATLALVYAAAHPGRVQALLLHAVFTATETELDWLYGGGAAAGAPEAWEAFAGACRSRAEVLARYAQRLADPDATAVRAAARDWCAWEDRLAAPDGRLPPRDDAVERSRAVLGVHYAAQDMFLEAGAVLAAAGRLAGIPGTIVQGRADRVTPPAAAEALHRVWPGGQLCLVDDGGHAATTPAMMRALLAAADRLTAAPVSAQPVRDGAWSAGPSDGAPTRFGTVT